LAISLINGILDFYLSKWFALPCFSLQFIKKICQAHSVRQCAPGIDESPAISNRYDVHFSLFTSHWLSPSLSSVQPFAFGSVNFYYEICM
jgi:hypothetical protein